MAKLCRVLTRLILDLCHPLALGSQDLTLLGQRLLSNTLGQVNRLLPHRDKRLRNLAGQFREAGLAAQPLGQARPPLVEQTADPRRATATKFHAHALDGRAFAAGQHRIRGGKHLVFRHPYCHG
ncbi:hypothetical protein D3C84_924380 [compost metagenome]